MFNKHKYSLIAHGPTARDTIFRPLIRQKKMVIELLARKIFFGPSSKSKGSITK